MTQSQAKAEAPLIAAKVEEEIAYLAKRYRVTPAIVREIIRRVGSSERGAVEREIQKGKARR
jgi:Mor family transcriptional regulator